MGEKIVLAYSGGLDTSVAIRWLAETYGYDVVALFVDVGEAKDPEALRQKALAIGAVAAEVVDAKAAFANEHILPALFANALYQGKYPLATALARPLIAKHLVAAARRHGAVAVAHGCTGKGNDQVRFELAIMALAPDLNVVAPVRAWAWSREEEIAYAARHGIPVPATVDSPYSVDANLWGRSVEGGRLEDPWLAPPEECYAWTAGPQAWPSEPTEVVVSFANGVPVALDGQPLDLVSLIEQMNALAGAQGVGRIDHLEDRLVGIKSREVYEAPAALALITAHEAAESITLPRDLRQHKAAVAATFAQQVYDGLWFSPLMRALLAYLEASQDGVTADVRLSLFAGRAVVTGVKAAAGLYRSELATYGAGDAFDATSAEGFIRLFGLPLKAAASARAHVG
jgi:argininosuccinate synthase